MIREEEERIEQRVGGGKKEIYKKSIPIRILFLTLNQATHDKKKRKRRLLPRNYFGINIKSVYPDPALTTQTMWKRLSALLFKRIQIMDAGLREKMFPNKSDIHYTLKLQL